MNLPVVEPSHHVRHQVMAILYDIILYFNFENDGRKVRWTDWSERNMNDRTTGI